MHETTPDPKLTLRAARRLYEEAAAEARDQHYVAVRDEKPAEERDWLLVRYLDLRTAAGEIGKASSSLLAWPALDPVAVIRNARGRESELRTVTWLGRVADHVGALLAAGGPPLADLPVPESPCGPGPWWPSASSVTEARALVEDPERGRPLRGALAALCAEAPEVDAPLPRALCKVEERLVLDALVLAQYATLDSRGAETLAYRPTPEGREATARHARRAGVEEHAERVAAPSPGTAVVRAK